MRSGIWQAIILATDHEMIDCLVGEEQGSS